MIVLVVGEVSFGSLSALRALRQYVIVRHQVEDSTSGVTLAPSDDTGTAPAEMLLLDRLEQLAPPRAASHELLVRAFVEDAPPPTAPWYPLLPRVPPPPIVWRPRAPKQHHARAPAPAPVRRTPAPRRRPRRWRARFISRRG